MMGEKDRARQEMAAAGMPVIPGSKGLVDDERRRALRGGNRLSDPDQGVGGRRRARDEDRALGARADSGVYGGARKRSEFSAAATCTWRS
jgi:biotin carboxylase